MSYKIKNFHQVNVEICVGSYMVQLIIKQVQSQQCFWLKFEDVIELYHTEVKNVNIEFLTKYAGKREKHESD